MKILVACEESQEVCKAFREKGHEAYSCDLQECSGGHPEWHICGGLYYLDSDEDEKIDGSRHGHWVFELDPIVKEVDMAYCSNCGSGVNLYFYHPSVNRVKAHTFLNPYCMSCGAKMDGGCNDV